MSSRLSSDTIAQMAPLLGSLSKLVAKGSQLGEEELRMLLLGVDLDSELNIVQEVKRWVQLLRALHQKPSEESRQVVLEALLLRGLPEASVLLAISTVTEGRMKVNRLKLSQERLDFGQLASGQSANTEFEVEGGSGQIMVENDQVRVVPVQFGPHKTRIRVEVKPLVDGVLWTSLKLMTPSETLEMPLLVQWSSAVEEGPVKRENYDNQRHLAPGMVLSGNRYKIEKLVAVGSTRAVYRAEDTYLKNRCAVKEVFDDFHTEAEHSQAVEWFKREAKLLLDLNHRCIPRIRDFFVEGGRHYLVMDFIEGRALGEVLEKEGNVGEARGLPEARVRNWAQQLCSVLGYLHRQNPPIIFRDLKPSNIMVTDNDEIKLVDFGIARTFQSQRQATVIMMVGYAPPEQFLGNPEPRSDIFALGATLHRLLTRHEAANNKPNLYTFPSIRSLRPDVSLGFEQIIMKALAFTVDQRWPNAAEMERAIINLPPVTAQPPTLTVPGPGAPSAQPSSGPRSGPGLPPGTVVTGGSTTGPSGAYIAAAQGHLAAGRIDAAYGAIQQAHTLEPNNPLVHKIFGQTFARRQPPALDQAMQSYNRSLQLNPTDAETHKLVGDVWLILRCQPAQAIPAYTQALRLNTNDSEAHRSLGECYESTGQLEVALREFQEAVRLAPKNLAAHYALAQLAFRMNQLPIAEREFVQMLVINLADHQARLRLAEVYEREGKLELAWHECNYVIGAVPTASPTYATAYALLGRLRARLGR